MLFTFLQNHFVESKNQTAQPNAKLILPSFRLSHLIAMEKLTNRPAKMINFVFTLPKKAKPKIRN